MPKSSVELDILVDCLVEYFVSDAYNYEVIRDELGNVAVDNFKDNAMSMEVIFQGRKFCITVEEKNGY